MLKPTNYDSLKIEDYTPIKLGGHYLKIIDVTESESKSGNPLIIVRFDFPRMMSRLGSFTPGLTMILGLNRAGHHRRPVTLSQ